MWSPPAVTLYHLRCVPYLLINSILFYPSPPPPPARQSSNLLPFSPYFSSFPLFPSRHSFFFLQYVRVAYGLSVCLSSSLSLSCFFTRCAISLQAARSMPGRGIQLSGARVTRYRPHPKIRADTRARIGAYAYAPAIISPVIGIPVERITFPFVGKRIDRFKLRLSSRISRDP